MGNEETLHEEEGEDPSRLKRNGSGSPFGRPPPSSDPSAQQPQGSAPGFTSVFNKSSFSKTLPTINANSSQAPTRVFGAIGQQNSNGPPTSSVGLPQNTKQQLMNVLGEKLQKSSAESLFNRKPLPTAPTFSHFKQQSAGSSTSPAKAKGSSHMDGSKKSFDGFGGPRSKGASTGFNFKHRSPLVNRFEAQEQMAGSSSNGRNIEKTATLKKAGAIHRVENRQNRAAVNNVWMDSPMASALRTSKGQQQERSQSQRWSPRNDDPLTTWL
uniref:Uncharacterized protein n=1 Tax=Ditylenchus dipsaci TaxID=166011 RepID=A0A915CXB7_9BILA